MSTESPERMREDVLLKVKVSSLKGPYSLLYSTFLRKSEHLAHGDLYVGKAAQTTLVPAAATVVLGPLIPAVLKHFSEMDRSNSSTGTLHTELQLLIEVLITFVKQVNLNCDL